MGRAWHWALAGAVLLFETGRAFAQTSAPGDADRIYAELAKLPAAERQAKIEEGARREGELSLIHTLRGEQSDNHVALFKKRYPFIHLDMTGNMGSQDAAERLVAEETAGRHLTDVVNLALPDLEHILSRNILATYPTPATNAVLPAFRIFLEPRNRWVPWYWSEHGISYNPQLVPKGKEPKSWEDLCSPAFKGSTSFDPAETDFLSGLYTMLGEQKTEDLLKCMGANDPIIQRGHSQRLELMVAGDHMVQGDNYLYHGLELKKKNPAAPYEMVLTAPILGFGGVAGINRNTPHPYASALYVDWTLSEESQKYVGEILRGPVAFKHPFLSDDLKIITFTVPPADVMQRLLSYWDKYMAKK